MSGAAAWVRCPGCDALVYGRRLERASRVCPECGHHLRLTAEQRIAQLTDEGSFVPFRYTARSLDVLGFVDSRPYPQRLAAATAATGLCDAVVCGTATIGGQACVLAVMDFRFMGGSLGAAVGEMVTHAAEMALDRQLPLVVVTASGGARMQEGALALMQMVKTSAAIARLRSAGLLTVSLITDPTYGGVAASYATSCDVLIAEPGARMGFAGPRVIRDTIRQELPPGFQTAEFLLRHGQVDMVVQRAVLPRCIGQLLDAARRPLRQVGPGSGLVTDADPLPAYDAWATVGVARDRDRPTTLDYVDGLFDAFVELRGERLVGDCPAVVAGLAQMGDGWVAVVGHQKGHTTQELVARNFGMPRPEGYRKAVRVMRLAARLGLPVVTFVDTPGAFPGADAEERGQAAAIATSVQAMAELATPVVTVITGEGGSGGALALAVADRVLALERATYSVISPEGCSAILWHDAESAPEAARALQLTARELLRTGIVDGVVPEPDSGAQRDLAATVEAVHAGLRQALGEVLGVPPARLLRARAARYRRFGAASGRQVDAAVASPSVPAPSPHPGAAA